ncbi:MAG: SDR family NAD(P)-dependent oxidoreductase [Chitinophagales bacterium]
MQLFSNQSIIITGAASGIGKATALFFAEKGANVVVSDIHVENGNKVVATIEAMGGNAIFVKTNVADNSEVEALIQECVHHFGGLGMMINNAGIGGDLKFFEQITDKDWNQIIAINQTGVFYCMRAALKVMKAQRKGVIINTSSVAGLGSAARMGAYAASKHAVIGMTKTAAVEYAKYGIRVNAICPTVIKTPMGDSYASSDPKITEMIKHTIPMKRFGEAEEVAKTIGWLCSEDASFITGHAIRIDGGMMA